MYSVQCGDLFNVFFGLVLVIYVGFFLVLSLSFISCLPDAGAIFLTNLKLFFFTTPVPSFFYSSFICLYPLHPSFYIPSPLVTFYFLYSLSSFFLPFSPISSIFYFYQRPLFFIQFYFRHPSFFYLPSLKTFYP